jgi:hypothetical protein
MTDGPPLVALNDVLARLDGGEELPEGALVRYLRSPSCPRRLVEKLAVLRWVRASRVLPQLLLRHRGCPRAFAWETLPRLGWHDILAVVRDPRTAPAIRRQGERKLIERLRNLTTGERTSLARLATRAVIAAMLADDFPACVQALLDNPQFTEGDAVRLLTVTRSKECAAAVVRHPRWGASRAVVTAAVRCDALPLGVALGLLVVLPKTRLEETARAPDVPAALRDAALELVSRRRARAAGKASDED